MIFIRPSLEQYQNGRRLYYFAKVYRRWGNLVIGAWYKIRISEIPLLGTEKYLLLMRIMGLRKTYCKIVTIIVK